MSRKRTFSLDKEEVNEHKFKNVEEDEEDVEPVANFIQGDGRREGVDKRRAARGYLVNAHSFGAHVVGKHLAWVDGLHGGEREG